MSALGIIAGAGDLPKLIYEDRIARGLKTLVVDFKGIEVEWAQTEDRFTARFEQPEAIFEALRDVGCTQVVMAGAMQRPDLDPSRFDATFAAAAPRLMAALQEGDDAGLRVVLNMFETAGFQVVAPQAVLSTLTMSEGCPTIAQPAAYDESDAKRAAQILEATSALDIGQGCVVAGGLCLGIETLQGTEQLLNFVRMTESSLRPERGLLMKTPKSGQEARLDVPAIGPDTIDQLVSARLSGVVIKSDRVLVINREEVMSRADAHGIFVWSRS